MSVEVYHTVYIILHGILLQAHWYTSTKTVVYFKLWYSSTESSLSSKCYRQIGRQCYNTIVSVSDYIYNINYSLGIGNNNDNH